MESSWGLCHITDLLVINSLYSGIFWELLKYWYFDLIAIQKEFLDMGLTIPTRERIWKTVLVVALQIYYKSLSSVSVSAPNCGLIAIMDMASASTALFSMKDICLFYSIKKLILRRPNLYIISTKLFFLPTISVFSMLFSFWAYLTMVGWHHRLDGHEFE